MSNKNFYVHRYCRQSEVSGSSFFYSVHWPNGENVRFFLDAGAFQGENSYLNGFFPFKAEKLSFGIITHLHFDHVGLLPTIVRQGFTGKIYTSYDTAKLMDVALVDTTTIVDKQLGRTIATIDEVERTLKQVVGCAYCKKIKPHKNIRIVFYGNGHLIGACVVKIIISCPGEEDIVIIHTGDYKDKNLFFDVELPPEEDRNANVSSFVVESTYGDVDSTDSRFDECLEENIAWAIKRDMTVICPTFAFGRHQETLYKIKTFKENGSIPKKVPVIIEGKSSQIYNAKFMYTDLDIRPEMRKFLPSQTMCVPRSADRKIIRKNIIKDSSPKIILAPGGMGDYGAVRVYMESLIANPNVLVHGLGYAAVNSVMYKLLHSQRGDSVNCYGNKYIRRCEAMTTSELTSHGARDIIFNFLNVFPYKKSISINHGELITQKWLRKYLLEKTGLPENQIDICTPEIGVTIQSEGITGIFKTHN